MTKERYTKYILKLRELNKNKVCEFCGKEHDHTYGTGRFCSLSCRNKYQNTSQKVLDHLSSLRKSGKISQRAPHGTWVCKLCGFIAGTRKLLKDHIVSTHYTQKECSNKTRTETPTCPFCGIILRNFKALGGHIIHCKVNPNKLYYDSVNTLSHETFNKNIKTGKIKIKGHKHSAETKQKLRIVATEKLKTIKCGCSPRYNPKSIEYFNKLAKEMGWNLLHAENGGEYYVEIGYFLDAYDKELNIVVEYDERKHYTGDINKNILRPKDIERQTNIINFLHCEFYRYNESTGVLWKVT